MIIPFPNHTSRFYLPVLLSLISMASARACTVPVFRYALERWPPDAHIISIASNVPLDTATLDSEYHANLWFQRAPADQTNAVRVIYPDINQAWYSGDWKPDLLAQLTDSPLRRRIAHELMTGTTAVFVMLESTDATSNATTKAMFEKSLAELANEIELPKELDYEDEQDGWSGAGHGQDVGTIPVRIDFSVLTVSRSDASETFLIKQIEGLDTGFSNPKEIVMVAVFGQGRMIPLAGEELVPAVINELCWFLCSACSCRVKALNPGVDMLLAANWDEAKHSYPNAVTTVLPNGETFTLGGTGIVEQASTEEEQKTMSSQATPEADTPATSNPIPPIAWLAVLTLIVTATLTWLLKK